MKKGSAEKQPSALLSENLDPRVQASTLRSKFSCRLASGRFSALPKLMLFFLGILILLLFWGYSSVFSAIDERNVEESSFLIRNGEKISQIADNLEKKGLIRSSTSFYWYTRLKGKDDEIIAGNFQLNTSMNVPEILTEITDQSKGQNIITIPEGYSIKEIDEKLTEVELIKSGEFMTAVQNFKDFEKYPFLQQSRLANLELPLEGYIFPDTYFLNPEFKPEELIEISLNNFGKKWLNGLNKMEKKYSNQQIITMASIIEEEVRGARDKEIVSGILWKRLENDWPLGADATLLYMAQDRQINAEDLASDSPYNTRKNKGLPPGPISNPGLESINAALYPVESEYWFYLTAPKTGKVIYSKTNEEHNLNRAKYS